MAACNFRFQTETRLVNTGWKVTEFKEEKQSRRNNGNDKDFGARHLYIYHHKSNETKCMSYFQEQICRNHNHFAFA